MGVDKLKQQISKDNIDFSKIYKTSSDAQNSVNAVSVSNPEYWGDNGAELYYDPETGLVSEKQANGEIVGMGFINEDSLINTEEINYEPEQVPEDVSQIEDTTEVDVEQEESTEVDTQTSNSESIADIEQAKAEQNMENGDYPSRQEDSTVSGNSTPEPVEQIEDTTQQPAEEVVETPVEEEAPAEEPAPASSPSTYDQTGQGLTRSGGVYDNPNTGKHETWYSQRTLPGGGLDIPGRHVDPADGIIKDGEGYICVASCDYPKGTVIETSRGIAKVYDYCPTPGTVDIYTDW